MNTLNNNDMIGLIFGLHYGYLVRVNNYGLMVSCYFEDRICYAFLYVK
jgi:hypothetical protein